MVVENLRYMLQPYNSSDPLYFGCKFKPYVSQGYMSGGAGYVLSKEALKRFVTQGIGNNKGGSLKNVGLVHSKCWLMFLYSEPESLKMSRQKNLCIFGSFKHFPSSKIDFWPFLKLQKMEFGQKNCVKLIYLISRVFWPGLF